MAVAGVAVVVRFISPRLDELPVSEALLSLVVGVFLGPEVAAVLEVPREPQPLLFELRGVLLPSPS